MKNLKKLLKERVEKTKEHLASRPKGPAIKLLKPPERRFTP